MENLFLRIFFQLIVTFILVLDDNFLVIATFSVAENQLEGMGRKDLS